MNLAERRDFLAKLYQDKLDIQRVADDAGIQRERIAFDTSPLNIWHQILSEAAKTDKLEELMEVVHKNYDNSKAYGNEIALAGTAWPSAEIQEETLFSLTIWKLTLAIIVSSLFLKRRPVRRVIVSITITSLFFILLVRWPETVQTIKRIYDNLKTIIEAPGPLPPVELPSPTPMPETVIPTPALSFTVTTEPAVQAIPAPIITPNTGRPQPIATAGNAPVSIPVQRSATPSVTPTPKTITATIIPFAGYICMLCQKSLNEGKSADDSNTTCNICEKFSKIPIATFVFITPPIQVTSIYTQATATSQAATPIPPPSFTPTYAETLHSAASSLTPTVGPMTDTLTLPTIPTDTPVTDTSTLSSTPTSTSTPSLTLIAEATTTATETATATPSLTPVVAPATPTPSPTPPSQAVTDTPTLLPTATPEVVTEVADTPTLPPPATEEKVVDTPTSLPTTTTAEPPPATAAPLPTPTPEPVIPTATPLPQPTSEPVVPTPAPPTPASQA